MSFKRNKLSALVAALSGLAGAGALVSPQVFAQEEAVMEEVVVQGFRQSLEAALNIKRESPNNVDSIVAEDIGKMPDLNLAESLQRVPGVAVTREGGEGRQITVRGLGPTYTRVTLNGMEVPASTGGLDSTGGVNRGRSFDFNVFSSDLFRRIDVNKTSLASIEEGGLAATVDLSTLRPMDRMGFNATAGVQFDYNYHTGEMDPRLTGMISNTFADDKVGILVGINRSERTVHQEGFGTVRWTGPASNLQSTATCSTPAGWGWGNNTLDTSGANPTANYSQAFIDNLYAERDAWNAMDADARAAECGWDPGSLTTAQQNVVNRDATLTDLDFMWAPRLPRMDSFNHDQTRTGIVASLQARPTDELELNLSVLNSELEADVSSYNYFAQFRNMHNSITPTAITLDPNGQYIVAGTFSNVVPRSESRGQFWTSDFTQIIATASYDFSDTLSLDVMLGNAEATHDEQQYRYNLTARTGHVFNYSFEDNGNIAEMSYDFDINDPAAYTFTGPVLRDEVVKRENETMKVDLTWEFDDNGSNLKTGLIANDRTIDSYFTDSPAGLAAAPVPSADNTLRLSQVVDNYGDGIGGPSGFPTDFIVANYAVVNAAYNAGEWNPEPNDSNTYIVSEDTMGAYVEGNYNVGNWSLNGGFRWVETTVQGNKSDLKESYTNTLPAVNVTFEPVDDVLLRASYSENIARPNPANLSGAVSYTPINGSITVANPGLKPETGESFDFGVEWYFAPESYVGLVFFSKDITDAITSETVATTLNPQLRAIVAADPAYDPTSPQYEPSALSPDATWNLTQSTNSDDVEKIDGFEIGFNYVTEIGVGFLANYTSLDTEEVVFGLSETSYNLGVFYENDTFGARIMVNDRDDYLTGGPAEGNLNQATTGPTRVDFSSSYNFSEMFDFTLEIINLTNEKERLYTNGPMGDLDLVREYNTTGTEIIFGVRASF